LSERLNTLLSCHEDHAGICGIKGDGKLAKEIHEPIFINRRAYAVSVHDENNRMVQVHPIENEGRVTGAVFRVKGEHYRQFVSTQGPLWPFQNDADASGASEAITVSAPPVADAIEDDDDVDVVESVETTDASAGDNDSDAGQPETEETVEETVEPETPEASDGDDAESSETDDTGSDGDTPDAVTPDPEPEVPTEPTPAQKRAAKRGGKKKTRASRNKKKR